MEAFICTACGTQYTPSSVAPRQCVICEEERQYVPPRGQTWTTLAVLAFGGIPIHLHSDDHRWIMRPDPAIQLWNGETLKLMPDLTLIRCGGHFRGGTVLHWAKGAGGRGVLCSSDIATVTTDRKFLSFMRSYPNLIPLSAKQVTGIAVALEPFQFDTVYGHYFDRVITSGGKRILEISVKRYVDAISGAYEHE
jgi:hypothetical protein